MTAVRLESDPWILNWPWYTTEVAVTPGTTAAVGATDLENPPCEFEGVDTIRSARMALSTLLVAELDSEAPKTEMTETRASPTMSAEAVCAVRKGLRMEFSRPSRPDTPSNRAKGRPMTPAIGLARAGARRATPMKMRTAPRPTSAMAGFVSPKASATAPSSVTTPPRVKRRLSEISVGAPWSDTAATGAIRTARRAGPMADTTVTPTPTSRHTTTVRVSKTSGPDGRVTPNPFSRASRPSAARTPRPRPTREESRPTMAASAKTERKT